MEDDILLTAGEVAKICKLSEITIRRLTASDQIPNIKFTRAVRYKKSEINNWLIEKMNGKSANKNCEVQAETNEGKNDGQ